MVPVSPSPWPTRRTGLGGAAESECGQDGAPWFLERGKGGKAPGRRESLTPWPMRGCGGSGWRAGRARRADRPARLAGLRWNAV